MQNDAGLRSELKSELEEKDVVAYWRGRAYIEAARMAHDAESDKTANTMTLKAIEPYLVQAMALVDQERSTHEGPLPDAVFEEGETLDSRFVIMLALLMDSERATVGGKTIRSMIGLSQAAKDKKIVLVLNGHNTALSREIALEAGFEVREGGTVALSQFVVTKSQLGYFDFESIRERKEPDVNLRAVRQKHNRVGRNSGHQRFNAKPQRQNFKGRGR